jgi:hypothetical protein
MSTSGTRPTARAFAYLRPVIRDGVLHVRCDSRRASPISATHSRSSLRTGMRTLRCFAPAGRALTWSSAPTRRPPCASTVCATHSRHPVRPVCNREISARNSCRRSRRMIADRNRVSRAPQVIGTSIDDASPRVSNHSITNSLDHQLTRGSTSPPPLPSSSVHAAPRRRGCSAAVRSIRRSARTRCALLYRPRTPRVR